MACLVCDEPAEEMERIGDYRGWRCPKCGPYRVSGTLLKLLQRRRFDIKATRERLKKGRTEYDEPTLTTYDENLLVDVSTQA